MLPRTTPSRYGRERAPLRVLGSSFLNTVLLVSSGLLLSCGPKAPPTGPEGESRDGVLAHHFPGAGVELLTEPGLPTLQLVRRNGDPSGAAAFAVFPPGGSAGALHMASLLQSRLDARGLTHRLQVHGIGFVVVRDVARGSEVTDWFRAVYQALHDPVAPEEVKRLQTASLLDEAIRRSDALSPAGLCFGELGAEGRDALSEAKAELSRSSYREFLEQLREETAVASRVGFSVVGGEEIVAAAQEAPRKKWSAGDPLDDSFTGEPQRAVVQSRGAREIRLALRVAQSEAALSAARSLQDPAHPLHARLHAAHPGLEASDVRVTLRPAGACVGLTVAFESDAQLPVSRVATVALLVQDELKEAAHQSYSPDEEILALLSPEGAREAAALAAWTAVPSDRTGGRHQEILEYRGTEGQPITHQALDRAVEETAAKWAERTLPVAVADESGQAEIWALLASPCGTFPESAEEAGLRALTVSALAQDWGLRHGVRLEPWISTRGLGLLAHSPPLRGESVAQHATRVARALASSFSGAPLDGRTLAAVRGEILERLGEDPGLDVVTAILGAGRPSFANPFGTSKTVATFSVSDAERTRADLAQEPLRLAILANAGKAQGQVASQALSYWLAPARDHVVACPAPHETPPPPGTWNIETVDEKVGTSAFVAVFAPAPTELGRATAYLLNRRGGYLDRAFSDPSLVGRAEAHFLGGPQYGGLYLQVTAKEGQLDQATHQARAVLSALANPGIPEKDVTLAHEAHAAIEEATLRTGRGRLIQLFETHRNDGSKGPGKVTPSSLRELHRKLESAAHRVVTVQKRK